MSIDTPPSPVPADAEALLAAAEGMGDNEIQALVARVVIDALGRPWDPLKHPRDAEGKFIETFAEVRGLFHTSGGAKGAPKVSGRVVAFDHNGDVWVRVDHVADGYTEHKPGDLVPIKPDDIQALDKLASIPKSLDGEQRTQIEALAARMEGRNPDAAAALRRAADPANTQPIAQLADLHEARDALDADGSSEAVAVRDMVWDLSDQLGDHPDNDEVIKAAQAMVRDHLAKEPTKNAEAIARLDGDIHAEAPPAQPSAPDAAQRLAGQLHGLADRLQDQNPADAVHVRNVAAKLGDIGVTGETPEKRDSRLEAAATQALKINNAQLKKKIIADIKHMRENPPQKDAPAEQAPDAAPKARLEPPSAAEPLPPVQTPGPDVPATPDVPEAPPTPPETPATPEARVNVPSAPSDPAASDPPVDSAPDDPEDVTPDDLEAEASIPAEVARPVAGDVGNGLAFENMPHGLVLSGDTYKNRQTIKDVGGFRWTEVPGQKDGKGQPLKAWTATGTEDQRYAALAKLADALGVPDPGPAADAPDEEYPPTPQQQEIIDAVYTGQDVVVRALAGTGKTSTLRMLARRLFKSDPGKRIVYVAFNKSIQEEAQKTMPSNVEARTGDSIAFATMSPAMKAKLNDKTLLRRNKDIADFLGIKAPLDMGPGQPPLSPEEQAMRIMRAIEKYSISADDELGTKHFENLPLDVADVLLPYAQKAWMDVTSDNGRIRATFSHFTKLWALSRPDFTKTTSGLKRKADIIFFDEAQDINPVMAKVIADQKIQKVYVGDGNQAIYGFRGAEDQLDKVKAEHDLPLTKSWRFGPQIAGMGNRFLALIGSKHRIEGAGPEGKVLDPDTMADPDAILVRSNAGAIGEILAAQTEGKLVGVPKGTKGDLRRLVDTARWLQQGGNPPAQVHDDLAAFRTWDEVRKAAEDGDDPKVKMLYGIIEENGIPALDDLVNRLIDTSDKADNRTPDLVVTTAHKSKGLEWDKVKIGGDFRGPRIDKKTGDLIMPSPEEMRLAYVAVTRAQKELDPGSLAWIYDYTNENGEEVKPETPTPSPEPPADLPSSPEHWSTPSAPPGTPDSGGDVTPPTPQPVAEVPPTPADVGAVPDGWTQPGDVEGIWNKGAYSVIDGKELGIDGLRVVEFDENDIPGWRADAANWDDVERLVADHESVKDGGGLEQKDRDHLAKLAERYGLGNDLLDAIKNGTPDQIQAALEQDAKYNEMKSAYTDALGAGTRNDGQKKAFQDWFDLNFEVLGALKQAKLLVGDDKPAPAAQEAPDTRTPQAPEVPPVAQPEVPGYSGEIRDIQPRDLAEILNAVENAKQWIDGYAENEYIVPGNKDDFRIHQQFQDDFAALDEAVRAQDFERAQQKLDDIKNAITPDVAEQFRDDVTAYVDQIQGVLDKVAQRDRGQFEIPGVAPQSVPPFAEHAAPELNAAFDDMVQHDPDVARDIKDLNDALIALESAIDDGGDEGDLNDQVRQVRQWLNERNYQAVINLLPGITGQHKFPTPWSERDITPEPRYSNYLGHERVQDVARRVESDWNDMLAAQAPESAPDVNVPASQEPLAEWEKELLAPTPAEKDMLSKWKDGVAELDADPLFQDDEQMGMVYNDIVQDSMVDDPAAIEQELRDLAKQYRDAKLPRLVEKADRIDEVIRKVAPGPESNIPGPYDPAADPEVVLPDVPGDGTPIKDERRTIDPRVRGEIEDVKRGVGLPELPDRLDIDRNGAAVFALDLVDVPAAGNQGKGDRRRPPGIGQVRRVYTKNGVRYAEVAFYDPAFVDYPNRDAAKAKKGIKNNSPFYIWDGIRIDKIQKVDGDNPAAAEYLGHLGPEEARQYAGRNAGRLAQNRGRVRPELERMANLKYIGDRYAGDADGLPVGKGDIVLYNGKKYEVARVNHNPENDGNTRLDLIPVGDDGAPELQAGGKHAEPYARMVRFYDQPLGDRQIGVTADELKDLVRRLDSNGKYVVGQPLRDALDNGDLKEVARAFNEDPAILDYVADGRAYINDYIQRLLNANIRGDFKQIDRHEQEMVRKDKNDLLNAMAAVDGRFLEGTGQDRHIRREIPASGPDQEYKGNQPEVLMPLRYAQVKALIEKRMAEQPENVGILDGVRNAVVHAGQINLDDEDDFNRAFGAFNALRRAADATGGLNDPELAKAFGDLQDAMVLWHDDQAKRKGMVQGGPGGEARLPGGRTVAPGLVRPPGKSNIPAPKEPQDQAYADLLGNNADARVHYQNMRDRLANAARAVSDTPDLAQYLDEANRALMNGNYGEALDAVENVLATPVDHPNADQLVGWQDRIARAGAYFDLNTALHAMQKDYNAGAPAAPDNRAEIDQTNPLRDIIAFIDAHEGDPVLDRQGNEFWDAVNGWQDGKDVRPQDRREVRDALVDMLDGIDDPADRAKLDGFIRYLDGAPAAPAAPAAPNFPPPPQGYNVGKAEDLKVGDIWVIENADDLGAAHPGIGEWKIQAVDKGDTADRYRVERVGGANKFGDNADAYLRHGMDVKIREGGIPQAPAPAAPAAPKKPPVDLPDNMYAHIRGRAMRVMPQAAKDAAEALNAGMAPNGPDLEALHDAVDDGVARHGGSGIYQDIKDWLDVNAPRAGAAPATPASPVGPREAADIRQAVADAVNARYEALRADRKNNAARKQALDVQDAGDAIDAALDQAISYHGSNNPDDVDTRDTEMNRARDAADELRKIDPSLADQVDAMLTELGQRFARDDADKIVGRYLDEAQKYHDLDTPNTDQRDRMMRAAEIEIDRVRRGDPLLADELAARFKDMQDKFTMDDVERAKAKPIGRTQAIDEFDAAVVEERKRLRDAGQKAEARALADDAEGVAEALNDAEDAHKAGDVDARDAAIEKARAAAEELDKTSPDLAEIARRAVEGNAARFARADKGGSDVNPGGFDSQEAWDRVNLAAQDFADIDWDDLYDMRQVGDWVRHKKIGSEEQGNINTTWIWKNKKTGQKIIIKYDDDGDAHGYGWKGGQGAMAEEAVARVYRDLGFAQPAARLVNPDADESDIGKRGIIVMDVIEHGNNEWGLEDPNTFSVWGTPRLSEFDPAYQDEVFRLFIANGIMGQTDRHGKNMMYGRVPGGGLRPIVIDNGLMLLNGAFGKAYGFNANGNPNEIRPDRVLFAASGYNHNANVLRKAAKDWLKKYGRDKAHTEMEQLAQRMQERARIVGMSPEQREYIIARAQWTIDNWEDFIDTIETYG